MHLHSSIYGTNGRGYQWRRQQAKEFNDVIEVQLGDRPIPPSGVQKILLAIKTECDGFARTDPEGWSGNFTQEQVDLYRSIEVRQDAWKDLKYCPHYPDITSRLVDLNNHNAVKVYMVMRDAANFGNKVNKHGFGPGEMSMTDDTIARKAKISSGYVHRAKKILQAAGLIKYVRKLGPRGAKVWWVKIHP